MSMTTIQLPSRNRIRAWRKIAEKIRWINDNDKTNTESGVELKRLLARRVGVQWSCDYGLLNLWKRDSYYYGSVQKWGTVTVFVKTEDFEKLLLWKYFKMKELE
jgi:hypothetical protein